MYPLELPFQISYAGFYNPPLKCLGIVRVRVLFAVLCTAHNTHAILGHAATPPYNKLRYNLIECFNINII